MFTVSKVLKLINVKFVNAEKLQVKCNKTTEL